MGSICGSSGTNTVVQQSGPPPQVLQQYQNVMNQANQVAQTPYQPYTGQLVAGMTPDQMQGASTIDSAGGIAAPYYQQGLGALTAGTNMGLGAIPYISGGGNMIGAGAGVMGSALPGLNTAAQYAGASAAPVNPGQFSGVALNQYMSPYSQDVIGSTLANIQQNNAIQQQGIIGSAIGAGNAFGGDRMGVAQAALANSQDLATNQTIAGLENQNYSQALGEFNTQQGVNLSAQQANAQRQAQAASLMQGISGTQANIGQGMGSLGNTYAGLGGLQAGVGATVGGLGTQTAGLGQSAQNLALQQGAAQFGVGSAQQQTQQAGLNAAYQQFLNQIQYPFQTTQWLGNLATGVGGASGGQGSTTSPAPSTLSQIGGAGLGAVGLIGGTGGFGANGWLTSALGGLGTTAATTAATDTALNTVGSTVAGDVLDFGAAAIGGKRGGRINGLGGVGHYDDGGSVDEPSGLGAINPIVEANAMYAGMSREAAANAGLKAELGYAPGGLVPPSLSMDPMNSGLGGGLSQIGGLGALGASPGAGGAVPTQGVGLGGTAPYSGGAGLGALGGQGGPMGAMTGGLGALAGRGAQMMPHRGMGPPGAPQAYHDPGMTQFLSQLQQAGPGLRAMRGFGDGQQRQGYADGGSPDDQQTFDQRSGTMFPPTHPGAWDFFKAGASDWTNDVRDALAGNMHGPSFTERQKLMDQKYADGGDVDAPDITLNGDTLGLGQPYDSTNPAIEADRNMPGPDGGAPLSYAPGLGGVNAIRVPTTSFRPGVGNVGPPAPPPPAGMSGDSSPTSSAPSGVALPPADTRAGADKSAMWQGIMAAGLGMMSGTSPFGAVNIGRGGLEGLTAFQRAQQLSQMADKTRAEIARETEETAEMPQNLDLKRQEIAQRAQLAQLPYEQATQFQKFKMGKPYPTGQHIDPTTFMPITTYSTYDPKSGWTAVNGPAPGASTPPPAIKWTPPNPGVDAPANVNPDALQSLPPDFANTVRAIDEGRQNLMSVPMRQRLPIERVINNYDPAWDQTTWAARNKQQEDMTTNGNAGKLIMAVNQLLPHLKTASDSAAALDNTNYPAANAVKNWLDTQTGDPRVKEFQTVREVAALDAARLLRGSGQMSEKDIEAWRQNLATAGSPAQMQGVLNMLGDDLIGARVSSIEDGYKRVMGHAPTTPLVGKEAQDALQVLRSRKPGAAGSTVIPPPAQRQVGQTYTSPSGQKAKWSGTGWVPVTGP